MTAHPNYRPVLSLAKADTNTNMVLVPISFLELAQKCATLVFLGVFAATEPRSQELMCNLIGKLPARNAQAQDMEIASTLWPRQAWR